MDFPAGLGRAIYPHRGVSCNQIAACKFDMERHGTGLEAQSRIAIKDSVCMRIDARLWISEASNDDEDARMKHMVIASCDSDFARVCRISFFVMTRTDAIIRPKHIPGAVPKKVLTRVRSDEAL